MTAKLLPQSFRLMVLGSLLGLLPGMARAADAPVGVVVKMTASAWGMTGGSGDPADMEFSGTGFHADSSNTAPLFDVTATRFGTSFAWYSPPQQVMQLAPGAVYHLTITGDLNTKNKLNVIAPPGYAVEIDGQIRTASVENLGNTHNYEVRILPPMAAFAERAGQATSITNGCLYWQVALGSLLDGKSAGALTLIDAATSDSWDALFTPAGLQYQEPSSEVYVYRSGGLIRQIFADQAAVDVVTTSATSYELRFYKPSLVVSGASYPYTFNGNPYVTYRIEEGATATTLKITKITLNQTDITPVQTNPTPARTAVITLTRSGTWPAFTWQLQDWNTSSATQRVEDDRTWAGSSGSHTEAVTIKDPSAGANGTIATQESSAYEVESWGEALASETAGTSSPQSTSYTYYTSSDQNGSYGFVKSSVAAGGEWQAKQYYDSASTYGAKGLVQYQFRPYNNLPATPTYDPAQGQVTYYEYADDAFGQLTRPTLIRTQVNGVTTAQATIGYTTQTVTQGSNTFTVVTATRQDSTNSSHSLTLVTKYFQEDTVDEFFRNQSYSVTGSDGVKRSYAYQRGTWNGSTFTASGDNGTDSGPTSMTVTITGTSNAANGSLCSSYNGFAIDSLYLVSGKSTLGMVVRDARALIVHTASYVWNGSTWNLLTSVDYTYDGAGLLTGRTSSSGASYSAIWSGDQKTSETDESGIKVSYTYDEAGRVETAIKSSGPTTTYTYDAVGHVLSQTLSASGTSETIVNQQTYDDAGRLATKTPAGLDAMTYTYDPANRTTTMTGPDGGTQVQTTQLDGQPASVTGTAVTAQYYSYAIGSNGNATTQVNLGTSNSSRWTTSTTDWLGRKTDLVRSGFTGQPNYEETYSYDTSTGRLTETTRTGYAPTLYAYDELGRLNRTGLDVDSNGLTLASNDRIVDSDQYFEYWNSAWWLRRDTKTYFKANDSTAYTTSLTRQRLTGFTGSLRSEDQTTDADGNTVVRTVDVAPSTATTTITTTAPGLANSRTETMVNGLSTSTQTPDGLTYAIQYDPLERIWKQIDPRNSNTTVLGYMTGTGLLQTATDAGSHITTYGYDTSGRRTSVEDALHGMAYTAYNRRGQVLRQWGSATTPVEYAYDTYGARIAMRTFRDTSGTFDGATWSPADDADLLNPDPTQWTSGDKTQWVYDAPSGLLLEKLDAIGMGTVFQYNARGQTSYRSWVRRRLNSGLPPTDPNSAVITTYAYDSTTGELTDVNYNDSTETIPTHSIQYTYTRTGQPATVSDATGSRTFNYDASNPWRLANEALDSTFYSSRILTPLYDSGSGVASAPDYGPYTSGSVNGRLEGFELGISGNAGRDLYQQYTYSDLGRFVGVNTRVGTNGARDFVYSYTDSSLLLSGYTTSGGFTQSYGYESTRDLRTSVDAMVGATDCTHFEYAYDALGQRRWSKQYGTAYGDYYSGTSYSAVYNYYSYDHRHELQSAAMFGSDTPPAEGSSPPAASELPGRRFEYRYDSTGNRTLAGPVAPEDDTALAAAVDDHFTTNSLNEYSSRENNTVRVLGTAAPTATVASPDLGILVTKHDRAFAADVVPPNQSGSAKGTVNLYAAIVGTGGGADKFTQLSRAWFVPPQTQTLNYDLDGNLSGDGVWDYTYDAENRLVRMQSALPSGVGFTRLRLDFTYDYLGRRVEKRVTDMDANTTVSDRRYVYEGWALIAETDTSGNIVRSYVWGLDIAGSLNATGEVGSLLEIDNHNGDGTIGAYFPTYDGNGNVSALIRSDGALAAAYEYSPAGELLRHEAFDSTVADNPFGFSTKFTDSESGLVYYGHRFYSPRQGRFINRDPIAEAGGLNLYGFCGNDGINNHDYLGNSWLSKLFHGIGHFFHSIGHWISKNWATIVSVALNFIPGVGPLLSMAFSTIYGAYTGGIKGALLGLAGSMIGGGIGRGIAGRVVSQLGLSGLAASVTRGIITGVFAGAGAAAATGGNIWNGMLLGGATGGVVAGGQYEIESGGFGTGLKNWYNNTANRLVTLYHKIYAAIAPMKEVEITLPPTTFEGFVDDAQPLKYYPPLETAPAVGPQYDPDLSSMRAAQATEDYWNARAGRGQALLNETGRDFQRIGPTLRTSANVIDAVATIETGAYVAAPALLAAAAAAPGVVEFGSNVGYRAGVWAVTTTPGRILLATAAGSAFIEEGGGPPVVNEFSTGYQGVTGQAPFMFRAIALAKVASDNYQSHSSGSVGGGGK